MRLKLMPKKKTTTITRKAVKISERCVRTMILFCFFRQWSGNKKQKRFLKLLSIILRKDSKKRQEDRELQKSNNKNKERNLKRFYDSCHELCVQLEWQIYDFRSQDDITGGKKIGSEEKGMRTARVNCETIVLWTGKRTHTYWYIIRRSVDISFIRKEKNPIE